MENDQFTQMNEGTIQSFKNIHINNDSEINSQQPQIPDEIKLNTIKQYIKQEYDQITDKNNQLKQIQEALKYQQEDNKSQPINFNLLNKHSKQYDRDKQLKEHERKLKMIYIPMINFTKSKSYIRQLREEEENKKQIKLFNEKMRAKRFVQLKYQELIRDITNQHQLQQSQQHLQNKKFRSFSQISVDDIPIDSLQTIDKNLIRKLEKILNVESDSSQFNSDSKYTINQTQLSIKKKPKSLHKLSPLQNKPELQIELICQKMKEPNKGIQKHKKIAELKIDEWKSIVNNQQISKNEKINKTINQIQKLNDVANKLENETHISINIIKEEKLNDLLINQIQARLSLLNNFEQ